VSDKHNATLCCGTYTVQKSDGDEDNSYPISKVKWGTKSNARSVVFVAHQGERIFRT
jgi:hypothetical protein